MRVQCSSSIWIGGDLLLLEEAREFRVGSDRKGTVSEDRNTLLTFDPDELVDQKSLAFWTPFVRERRSSDFVIFGRSRF